MASDDMFRIIYFILKELCEFKKKGAMVCRTTSPWKIKTYGSANGAIACQMYNELARLQDASAPDAEMAELPDYPEVAMAVYGTINNQHSTILETVERMTKQVEVDTMLKNARRDNVEWAWVPNWAETCVFCITIASQRWMPTACASLQFARNF